MHLGRAVDDVKTAETASFSPHSPSNPLEEEVNSVADPVALDDVFVLINDWRESLPSSAPLADHLLMDLLAVKGLVHYPLGVSLTHFAFPSYSLPLKNQRSCQGKNLSLPRQIQGRNPRILRVVNSTGIGGQLRTESKPHHEKNQKLELKVHIYVEPQWSLEDTLQEVKSIVAVIEKRMPQVPPLDVVIHFTNPSLEVEGDDLPF